MALSKAGIGKGYDFGVGGTVVLDEDGMPNGIFREQASKIYDELIPDPFLIPENKKKYMKKGFDLAVRVWSDHDAHLCCGDLEIFGGYKRLYRTQQKGRTPCQNDGMSGLFLRRARS